MGADVNLQVKELSLLYWKSYFDKETLGLFFTDDDLVVNKNFKYDDTDEDEEPHTQYKYSTTVGKALDRLNSAGYTLKKIEKEFNLKKSVCLDYWNLLNDLNIDDDKLDEVQEERMAKYVSFIKWQNAVWKYASYGLENGIYLFWKDDIPIELKPKNECDKLVYHSLTDHNAESLYGCLVEEFDPINTIRLILEKCEKNTELYVDITEMIGWTYGSIEDMRIGEPIEKNIVLVEGTSDKSILEFALKNIYPHLYNLYYFMDFEYAKDKNRQGGVDAISNNIKTFITSKLKTKFIAIFDNDTIGKQAKERLLFEIKSLPDNCRLLTYPDISLCKRYPTIATTGKILFDNINGRASSLELYLPLHIIKQTNGTLPPIEWESRVRCKVGQKELVDYQGVIATKGEIKDRFVEYKKQIEKGSSTFIIEEWGNMKTLLDEIIFAFN